MAPLKLADPRLLERLWKARESSSEYRPAQTDKPITLDGRKRRNSSRRKRSSGIRRRRRRKRKASFATLIMGLRYLYAFLSYALYTYKRNTDNAVLIYSGFHRNNVSLIIDRLNGTTWKYINLICL